MALKTTAEMVFEGYHDGKRHVTVSEVLDRLGCKRLVPTTERDAAEVRSVMKQLDRLGFGRYVVGRHGGETRLELYVTTADPVRRLVNQRLIHMMKGLDTIVTLDDLQRHVTQQVPAAKDARHRIWGHLKSLATTGLGRAIKGRNCLSRWMFAV